MTTEKVLAEVVPRLLRWRILDSKWDGRSTFTIEETAEILGVSRSSAYAAAKKGEIPVVWIGRRAIVPRIALEQKLAGTAP